MDLLNVSKQNSMNHFSLPCTGNTAEFSHRSEDIQALFKIDENERQMFKKNKSVACLQFLTNLYVPTNFTETCIANNGLRN
jgi:hypothetical protein